MNPVHPVSSPRVSASPREAPTCNLAALYRRVSTDLQDNSLAAQEERVADYLRLRRLIAEAEFADAAVSGRIPLADRPGGSQLLNVLACGRIKHLVVAKLDRIARNAGDFLNNLETFKQLGVTLHIVDMGGESLTTSGAYGKFTLTIIAGVAELECELIRGRINDTMAQLRNAGHLTGTLPYGWDLSTSPPNLNPASRPQPKHLIPNLPEQHWLTQMAAWRAAGLNYHRIARQLNEHAVPTKRAGQFIKPCQRFPQGKLISGQWDTGNVKAALTNQTAQHWLATLNPNPNPSDQRSADCQSAVSPVANRQAA